jgi:hypothetical protein
MAKTRRISCGDGTFVMLNNLQLAGLFSLPASCASWPTYYALRRRGLVEDCFPQKRTLRGEAVIANAYKRKQCQ